MLNLVLHCGAAAVDRDAVAASPTPIATRTWQPIPHGRLLGLVEGTLERGGLHVVNHAHALTRDGARYFGLLELRNGQPVNGHALVVGVRNSHDQSFPAGLVIGSGTFICDNLCFSGEVVLARRHTVYIQRDLPELVNRAVGQLGDLRRQQEERLAAYKATQMERRDAHHLLIEALRMQVLPATRLPVAVREYDEPSHDEFREHGPSAFRLLMAVTEAIKGRNLDALPRRTQALHGLLDGACGLAA